MARPSELRSLEALEQSYRELLITQLALCTQGAWGLFAANPPYRGEQPYDGVATLIETGDHIADMRQRLGFEPFVLHARLLAERDLRGEQIPGEPKRAAAWLAELQPPLELAVVDDLARGWIARAVDIWEKPEARADDHLQDFWRRLNDLAFRDPVGGVRVCAVIADLTEDERVLCLLGSGPLENILALHKAAVLPSFLREARANPRFRTALRDVWPQGAEAQPHWAAFQAVRDRLELPKIAFGDGDHPRRQRD